MAVVNPKIVYNFNENSATTIRDYSENGNDGTSSTITVAATTRSVGYDAVFNAQTEVISMGNITSLNGSSSAAIHLAIRIDASGAGTDLILYKSGQIKIAYNYTSGEIECSLTDAGVGTLATVTAALSLATWYDVDLVYASNVITLYVDGVSIDTDSTLSGALVTNANVMYIGYDGAINSALFLLNEFKLFSGIVTTAMIAAWIAEQNGILSDSSQDGKYNVGDVIGANLEQATPLYGVVTWVGSGEDFRFLPISENIRLGLVFTRVAHLWDTARQWGFKIDDSPSLMFYDLQTKSSEVFTAEKRTVGLDRSGLYKQSTTKTADYTTTSLDNLIYVDSSGGAFTITLDASPTTNKEIEIIDSVGSCGSSTVTIAGNGNNIIGSTSALMNSNYIAFVMVYNGTQWNLK